jgi:hypothetical protein
MSMKSIATVLTPFTKFIFKVQDSPGTSDFLQLLTTVEGPEKVDVS